MKSHLIVLVLLLSVFVVTNSGCKKTVIQERVVEVEKKTAWTELKDLHYSSRVVLNSAVFDDSTIAFVNKGVVATYNSNTLNFKGGYIFGFGDFTIGNKPAISPDLLITANRTQVLITASTDLQLHGKMAFIGPSLFDTGFIEFVAPYSRTVSPQAIVKGKYVLLPCLRSISSQQQQFAYLARINSSIDAGASNSIRLSVDTIQMIRFTPVISSLFGSFFSSLTVAEDKIFIAYGADTYRVDTSGNVKAFGASLNSISAIFKLNGNLFAVDVYGTIYTSSDKGESWNVFYRTNNPLWGYLSFQQIGEDVFAFYQDQIWQLTLSSSTMNIKELQNEGLERSAITSINRCGSKIFVTSLFGVYYRSWDLFKTYK